MSSSSWTITIQKSILGRGVESLFFAMESLLEWLLQLVTDILSTDRYTHIYIEMP